MSCGLDESLERMARWEALRQRTAGAHHRDDTVVDELVEAVGAVLQQHGPLAVTVTVEAGAEPATIRLDWRDGQLSVTRVVAEPPRTAAALAELIRADPSLLRPHGVTD